MLRFNPIPRLVPIAAGVIAVTGASAWFFRSPVIGIRVAADSAARSQPDWEGVVRRRIETVSDIYRRQAGVRWKVVDFVHWEASPTGSLDPRPRELRNAVGLGKADVLLGITARSDARNAAETVPFFDTAVAVIPPGLDSRQAARVIAQELAHLFGATHSREPAKTIMDDPPGGDEFDPAAARVIRALRRHEFRGGPAAMSARSEKRALEALPLLYRKGKIKPEAQARYILGVSCVRTGAAAAGIRHLREAVKLDPEFHVARFELAGALVADHERDQAISELRDLIRRGAGSSSVHASLAELLNSAGDRLEAIGQAAEAVRKNPGNPHVHLLLGTLLIQTPGELESGIAAIKRAVALAPDLDRATQALAAAETTRRRRSIEIENERKQAAAKPADSRARYRFALALIRGGKLKAARAEIEQVLRLDPNFAEAHANLAVLLYGERDYAGAQRAMNAAQKLGGALDARFVSELNSKVARKP